MRRGILAALFVLGFLSLAVQTSATPGKPYQGIQSTGATYASGTPTLEAGFPIITNQTNAVSGATIVVPESGTFTAASGNLLVAVYSGGGGNSQVIPLTSITGGGLTWTLRQTNAITGSWPGLAGVAIYTATSTGAAMSVTATSPFDQAHTTSMAVYSFSNATVGNAGGFSGTDTVVNVGYDVTTSAGSILVGGYSEGATATPGSYVGAYSVDGSATSDSAMTWVSTFHSSSPTAAGTTSMNLGASYAYTAGSAIEVKAP
jgi:hypothetical protein